MIGFVENGRALLPLALILEEDKPTVSIQAWIDTGFTGELVLPASTIHQLGLKSSSVVDAVLADGSQVVMNVFECLIDWFGERRRLEIIANSGQVPLLGIGLLLGKELVIDYSMKTVSLLPSSRLDS